MCVCVCVCVQAGVACLPAGSGGWDGRACIRRHSRAEGCRAHLGYAPKGLLHPLPQLRQLRQQLLAQPGVEQQRLCGIVDGSVVQGCSGGVPGVGRGWARRGAGGCRELLPSSETGPQRGAL